MVESNVVSGEVVVDNTVNLFQIADVSRLQVVANCPEDSLPTLEGLSGSQRQWIVRTAGAESGLRGTIDEIGYLIDPNQHTAVIKGYVENPGQRIRGGQYCTATVDIPPPGDLVEIPTDALLEDGLQSVVFVQPDAAIHRFTMRRVQVSHRFEGSVYVRSSPIPKEEQLTAREADEGLLPAEPLRGGERVLLSGAVELKAALLELESRPEKKPDERLVRAKAAPGVAPRLATGEKVESGQGLTRTRSSWIPRNAAMVRKLIAWALDNPLVVILLAIFLAAIGIVSFLNVNVEAYPDPAPAIVEVLALFPGASAEEVERQVTVPLEVTFYAMPGLKKINSKSLFGLSDLKMTWHYGSEYTYQTARQEVINRIATISQPLPPNVTPVISPESPTGEIFRYVLKVPKDKSGKQIYTLNDIKAMQDWVLEREFRKVPRIVDLTSFGGTVRRYEVQPDPDRLRRYGITLPQLQATLTNANSTVGGDYINPGQVAMTVRSVGLFGGALDPVNKVLGLKNPAAAAATLRAEELRRIREIRALVITSVNNQPIRIEDVVEGEGFPRESCPANGAWSSATKPG